MGDLKEIKYKWYNKVLWIQCFEILLYPKLYL